MWGLDLSILNREPNAVFSSGWSGSTSPTRPLHILTLGSLVRWPATRQMTTNDRSTEIAVGPLPPGAFHLSGKRVELDLLPVWHQSKS